MAAFSEMHFADRFAEYVIELHEFSESHRVPHGIPENLRHLLNALRDSQVFSQDFASMIRSIVLREHFHASDSDLLSLVAIAWGGPKADDSVEGLASIIQELQKIIHGLIAAGTTGQSTKPTENTDELPNVFPELTETIREIEQSSPDVQMYRQLLKLQDGREQQSREGEYPVLNKDGASTQDEMPICTDTVLDHREQVFQAPDHPLHEPPERSLAEKSAKKPIGSLFSYGSEAPREIEKKSRLNPSAAEIIAMGLTGLVVALLFNVGSLPVYRVRVSVYLSAATGTTASANLNDEGPSSPTAQADSREELIRNEQVTEKVAARLLASPHPNPILRQDALSRGMRDLHVGGSEPILYANLVSETAREVKVRHLQPRNLYEITCDSWSPHFAATFCDEMLSALGEQPVDGDSHHRSAESGRTIDAAAGPGIQVYPHWYLQSLIGLVAGSLVGFSLGFLKRPLPKGQGEHER